MPYICRFCLTSRNVNEDTGDTYCAQCHADNRCWECGSLYVNHPEGGQHCPTCDPYVKDSHSPGATHDWALEYLQDEAMEERPLDWGDFDDTPFWESFEPAEDQSIRQAVAQANQSGQARHRAHEQLKGELKPLWETAYILEIDAQAHHHYAGAAIRSHNWRDAILCGLQYGRSKHEATLLNANLEAIEWNTGLPPF